jgi:hypothetical protein
MVPYYILVAPANSQPSGRPYYGLHRNVPASAATSPEGRAVWEEEREAFAEDDEWCLFFDSLDTAIEFRRRYAAHGYAFDLLAVYACESPDDATVLELLDGYLGLDVTSTEPHSVLHPEGICQDIPRDAGPPELVPIWRLEQRYFRSRINQWGLLNDFEDGVLLRDLTRALSKLDPTQGDPVGVRVLGIVQVNV